MLSILWGDIDKDNIVPTKNELVRPAYV